MAWRLYARRTTTGDMLHNDVPAVCDLTWQLNATGHASGFIPSSLDVASGVDGRPIWLERGTTLLAEEDNRLKWVGLCSWQRPTAAGRELEFKGLTSHYDLIGFDGRIREWQPDPFDMVSRLMGNAHGQPDGDIGINLERQGNAPTYAGDEQPPHERPPKVKRRRGETKDHFEERQDDRQKEQDQWDKAYGDREPYSVAWWEAPYVLEEIRELAREIPFDWWEDHEWLNRDAFTAAHRLVVAPRKGRQRSDLALVQGQNIAEALDPTTDSEGYGNHVVILGAGEGKKMRRAATGKRDGRVRTTRFGEAKHVRNHGRLQALARDRFARAKVAVKLDQAAMRGDLGDLELGDEVLVDSDVHTGWCRVFGITRNTRGGNVTLTFTAGGDAA